MPFYLICFILLEQVDFVQSRFYGIVCSCFTSKYAFMN